MGKSITIIQSSSRSQGDTFVLSQYIRDNTDVHFVDLKTKNIGQYDYDGINDNDDFLPTISEIIEISEIHIFLTPVYWYAMSGLMKTFLDRYTDMLKSQKDLGRQLRNKYLGCLSVSNDAFLDYDFALPIEKSADYLGMHYLGHKHCCVQNATLLPQSKLIVDEYFNQIVKLD